MGSTIYGSKRVGAIRTAGGRIGYALFEETHESNMHPALPTWSCVGVGFIESVMARIFALAGVCEGGSLRSRNGRSSPESYIRSWLEKLKAPYQLHDRKVQLDFGDSFGCALPESLRQEVLTSLKDAGLPEAAAELDQSSLFVELARDFAVIDAIYGRGHVGAWRVVHFNRWADDRHDLGYAPTNKRAPRCATPNFVRLGQDDLFQLAADGSYRHVGWDYEVVGGFVETYAATELLFPGSYATAIGNFRKACTAAPAVGHEISAAVDINLVTEDWQRRMLTRIATRVGRPEAGLKVRLDELEEQDRRDSIYALLHLPGTRWFMGGTGKRADATTFAAEEVMA